jgi:hypothetical protein
MLKVGIMGGRLGRKVDAVAERVYGILKSKEADSNSLILLTASSLASMNPYRRHHTSTARRTRKHGARRLSHARLGKCAPPLCIIVECRAPSVIFMGGEPGTKAFTPTTAEEPA